VEQLLVAAGLVFLAELGDKSMLLAVAFAARYRAGVVFAGIATAALLATGAAAALGAALGAALPQRALAFGSGVLFLAFGWWTLRGGDDDDDDDEGRPHLRGRSVFLGVTAAFLLAEIGDKTTLATAALASTGSALPTWLGAALGMTAASGIAIVIVSRLGRRVPERTVRLLAGAAFIVFGLLLVLEGLRG